MKKITMSFALMLALTSASYAEDAESATIEETIDLDQIVVSATKTARTKKDVSVSIDSIQEDEVKKKPAQSVLEVLRDVPGVEVADDAGGGMKYIKIRGESTRRTLIMVDGQPLSLQKSMSGGMPIIGKNQIKRIEVIKGPASVLHGSEAIGGVVNIITKKGGDKPFGGSISTSFDSSNNSMRNDFDISGTVDGIEYAISYGNAKSHNVKTPNGYLDNGGMKDRYPSEKRISGTGSNSEEHSIYLGYKNEDIHTGVRYDKNSMDYQTYVEKEIDGAIRDMMMDIPDSVREKYSAFLELNNLTKNFKKLKLDAFHQKTVRDFDIYMDYLQVFPVMNYYYKNRTHNVQTSDGGNIQMDWEFDNHYIIAGLNVKNDDLDGTYKTKTRVGTWSGFLGLQPFEHYIYDAELLTTALYLQDEWKLTDSTILTAGLRYTQVESDLNYTDDPDITTHIDNGTNSEDDNYSFTLGLVHHLNEDLSLRANYSQGYRHANLVELYTGVPKKGRVDEKAGDPNLDAETSESFELGARYDKDGLNLDFAVFYTQAENYIMTNATKYENIGGADTMGAELAISYELGESGFKPYASLTHLKRELDYGQSNITKDSGVPSFSGRYGLKYLVETSDMSSLEFDLFARFASDVEMEYSDATTEESKSWETMNLEVSYALETEGETTWEIYGGVYNIFDREYKAFNELTAAGTSFVAGLTVSF